MRIRNVETKEKLIQRLMRIEGQVRGMQDRIAYLNKTPLPLFWDDYTPSQPGIIGQPGKEPDFPT